MDNGQIKCEIYYNEISTHKHKSGLNYCDNCKPLAISDIMPNDIRPISQEEFDKYLINLSNTQPVKLKVLKERLKKEREEKRNSKDKNGSK